MASARPPHADLALGREAAELSEVLDRARRSYYEDPAGALADAVHSHEVARSREDGALCARARALQAAVSLHRGDLHGALELAVKAERYSEHCDDFAARVEVAALKAQLSFFTGSYAEALGHAEVAVQMADRSADAELRIYARRSTCIVFGNVGVRDWKERLEELLELTVDTG